LIFKVAPDIAMSPSIDDGWQAVPRSIDGFLANVNAKDTKPYSASDVEIPSSELAKKTMEYAKEKLSKPTFHHSMRVFYYGSELKN
jgi:cyanamide hydratase